MDKTQKKQYLKPKFNTVLFETASSVMNMTGSGEDVFDSILNKAYLNDLPNGTFIDPADYGLEE